MIAVCEILQLLVDAEMGRRRGRMRNVVELIVGPAGSGKTAQLLSHYRRALGGRMSGRTTATTLWLTPTSLSRRNLLAQLPDASLPICFAPNIFTFDEFAEQVLESSGEAVHPISDPARRLLVSQLIDDLLSKNELKYFAPIAQTSGFVDLVLGFIAELKRNEIWPERFVGACMERGREDSGMAIVGGDRGLGSKDRELARIYERYQELLNQHDLYDAEGRFWSARDVLKRGSRGPFDQLSLVVVDGFADFTHTQYEILAHLSRWAECLMISLPGESTIHPELMRRHDLFAKPAAANLRLNELFEGSLNTFVCDTSSPSNDRPFALRHLGDFLFTNPREIPRATDATGIEVLAVTGQVGEVRALAEGVKQLLSEGVGPDEIIIAVRSLEDYADLIEETFSAAGIPFACPPAGRFSHAPILKALVAVLHLESEDWPFERLKSLLLSNYLQPEDRAAWEPRIRVRAVSALRQLGTASGREAYLKGLQRAIEEAGGIESTASGGDVSARNGSGRSSGDEEEDGGRGRPDDAESRLQAARNAQDACVLLEQLMSATKRLRVRAPFRKWVELLLTLANELGISPRLRNVGEAVEATIVDQDRTVWKHFERMLFDAAQAVTLIDGESRSIGLREFTSQLIDLIHARRLPHNLRETGSVRVLEAADVRNLDVPYLFVAGLTESSFPRARHDDCLYNESERKSLNALGLTLAHRSAHSQDEMLLFYQVVTRARKKLTLSYPSVNSSGLILYPSPYLMAICDLFKPSALDFRTVGDLDPVPSGRSILTDAELRLVATAGVRENQPELFRAFCDQPRTGAIGRSVLAAVDAAVARFSTRGFTEYEGQLHLPGSAADLAARFPPNYQFSATQLEQYAFCPFRFFLSNVLKIVPLSTVQTATDYLGRGVLLHDVLAELHRPMETEESSSKNDVTDSSSIVDRFRALVQQKLERRLTDSDLQSALREVERMLLCDWAEAYGDQYSAYRAAFAEIWGSAPETRFVETAFGSAPSTNGMEQETSYRSLLFGTAKNKTHVRGRIDRVDVGFVEDRRVFNVIDYKTGSPPRFDFEDVASGKSLQLALYTIAVMRYELAGRGAMPFQMGYWSLRETGYVSGLKGGRSKKPEPLTPESIQQLEQTLDEFVPRLASGIRSGEFPVMSLDDDCTGRCPYSTVCRVNQIRPLDESLEKRRNSNSTRTLRN